MITILKFIITEIFWRFIFNHINRIHFVDFTNNLRVHLLAMPFRNLFNYFWSLITNRLPNNNIFNNLPLMPAIDLNSLINTNSKRFFWLGLVSTLLVYKQFILFKRLILWPFKLGIFTFIFSTFGIDLSWFLGWFNIFPLNIPQWVYIQYLTLYGNWLNWWHSTADIKNISKETIPSAYSNKFSDLNKYLETESVEDTSSENKIFNRRNLFILLGVLALVGVGVWYFYYNNGTGSAGGGNNNIPPAGGLPPVAPTDNVAGLTEAQRIERLDMIERLRLSGRISMAEYDNARERLLPPLPAYQAPTVDPTIDPIENIAEASGSNSQAVGSTSRTSPTHPDPRLARDYNRLFQLPEDLSPQAEASTSSSTNETIIIERSNTPPIDAEASTSTNVESSASSTITTEASSSSPSSAPTYAEVARSSSPTGSTDSSETVTNLSYTDSKGKSKLILPRRN